MIGVPPLTVIVFPPEPTRLEASICSDPVAGMFTPAPVQNSERMTPLGRFVSTLTELMQIDAVSPVKPVEPGTCPQLQFAAWIQLRAAPPVKLPTAASALG